MSEIARHAGARWLRLPRARHFEKKRGRWSVSVNEVDEAHKKAPDEEVQAYPDSFADGGAEPAHTYDKNQSCDKNGKWAWDSSGRDGKIEKVSDLPLFDKKIGWRGDSSRMSCPRGLSAADVIRYERDELGNDSEYGLITPELLKELKDYHPFWVTRTKKAARRYGEPTSVEISKGARVIVADDGDGGCLLAYLPKEK